MNTHFLTNTLKSAIIIGSLLFPLSLSLANAAITDGHKEESKAAHKDEHLDDHDDGHVDKASDEHGDEHGEEGHIEISAQTIKTVGITTQVVSAGEIKQRLTLYGSLTTDPSAVSQVRARFPGLITKLTVHVGDKVNQGQVIAEVESNNSLSRYNIVAPISGIISNRHANQGEIANEQVLLTIKDYQQLWLELQVFPTQQAKISVGQTVTITSEQQQAESIIKQLLPTHTDTPFIVARVPLDNTQSTWTVGNLLSGSVVINTQTSPIVIDNLAIQVMEGKQVVFIKNEHGFEVRVVNLGLSDGQFSQVSAGLAHGEIYALQNSYLLKAELEKSSAAHHH
jgi:cobalt-zinc-cadmium efflux system membrane fusion protein